MLLHSWACDRTWWEQSGYSIDLQRDFCVINVDLRGHGESDKPHDPSAYLREMVIGDVFTVAEAEGLDTFAIWGLSYGGWNAWAAADSEPDRVVAIVTTGAWDPRPGSYEDWVAFDEGWGEAIRRSGMQGLVDLFKEADGADHDREFPPWARAVTLRADPLAMLAINSRELYTDGIQNLDRFPVPTLLIAGEFEDEDDDAAKIAAMLPRGESLRLLGLGTEARVPRARSPFRPREPSSTVGTRRAVSTIPMVFSSG